MAETSDSLRIAHPRRSEAIRPGTGDEVVIATGVSFREFAGKACGANGFTTGKTNFSPRSALPYHKHDVSEAVVVLSGTAQVTVEGREYLLQAFDSMHIPAHV